MQAEIEITGIKSLSGNYSLIDFSISHKESAAFLEKHGLIDYQHILLPVIFFNQHTKKGQLFAHQTSLALVTGQHIEVKLSSAKFKQEPLTKKVLILAKGIGLGYALFLAKKWKHHQPVVLLEINQDCPFAIAPSHFVVKTVPAFVTAAIKTLEDLGIVSRLASQLDQPGCFQGSVIALAKCYLQHPPTTSTILYVLGNESLLTDSVSLNRHTECILFG